MVISHLVGRIGAKVIVTVKIAAPVRSAVPENVVRTVAGNSGALRFTGRGFDAQ
jgi:hypothetical protein